MPSAAPGNPLFSIITVCYQALEPLQRTVAAVAAQDFKDYEHIVVDGASGDGTAEWLAGLDDPHIRWISEPDRGLYDAMNKGQALARGTYLWFVNAGDLPEGPSILSALADTAVDLPDVLYGEVLLVAPDGEVLGTRSACTTQVMPATLHWRDLRYGMKVSHQGILPQRRLAPPYRIDNLCADIDWMIVCLKRAGVVRQTGLLLARFETGGLSRQRHRRSLRDRYAVLREHFGTLPNLWHHGVIVCRALWQRLRPGSGPRY